MNFLLDSNVISELSRPAQDHGVIAWLDGTPEDALHISVATLAELHHGVEKLPQGYKYGNYANYYYPSYECVFFDCHPTGRTDY